MTSSMSEIQQKIAPILLRYRVKKAGLFGSIVQGAMRKESDIDILVELEPNLSLLDLIGLKLELEDILHQKVDLVEYTMIKPRLKERILAEEVRIL
jgi:predicted nucleotidyltransferase